MFGRKPPTGRQMAEEMHAEMAAESERAKPTGDYAAWVADSVAAMRKWHVWAAEQRAGLPPPAEAFRIVRNTEQGTWTVQSPHIDGPYPPPSTERLDRWQSQQENRTFYAGPAPDWAYYDYANFDHSTAPTWVWRAFGPIAEFNSLVAAERWLHGWIAPIDDVRRYGAQGQLIEDAV